MTNRLHNSDTKSGGGGGEENLHSKCTPVFHTKNAVPSYAWILLQNFRTLPHERRTVKGAVSLDS